MTDNNYYDDATAGDWSLDGAGWNVMSADILSSKSVTTIIDSTKATDLTDSGASTLHYHTADRARANHTGTQTASTISDFDTEVANNSAVSLNTAKVTNATHTGEVTGSGALTIANNVIDEANMKISNSPTNDYVLTADSAVTGGWKWAANDGEGVTSIATSGAISGGTITSTGTITHLTTAGYKHIPTAGATNQYLKYSSSGTAVWATPNNNAITNGAGYTTNTGTVTSVAVSGSDGIEVDSGSPVTTSGTIAIGVNKATMLSTLNVEDGADVTDTANVTSAGALMDSEVTNLADVKSFDPADYATAAQGSTADSAMQDFSDDTSPTAGGTLDMSDNIINDIKTAGFNGVGAAGSKTGNFNVDFDTDQSISATLTANTITMTLQTPNSSDSTHTLYLTNGGLATLTIAAESGSVYFVGGTVPEFTSLGTDICACKWDGTNWWVIVSLDVKAVA